MKVEVGRGYQGLHLISDGAPKELSNQVIAQSDLLLGCRAWEAHLRKGKWPPPDGTGKREGGLRHLMPLPPARPLVCLKDHTARRLRMVPELPAFAHADPQPGRSFSIPLLINIFSFSKKQFSHASSRRSPRTMQEAKLLVCPPRTSFALNLFIR